MAVTTQYLASGSIDLAAINWQVVATPPTSGTGIDNTGSTYYIPDGSQSIITSLDQSALTTSIVNFYVGSGFSGNMRTSAGGAFKIAASGVFVNSAAAGQIILQAAGGTSGANTIAKLVLAGGGRTDLVGGIFTAIEQASGVLNIDGATTAPTISVAGGLADIAAFAGVTITALTAIGGGSVTCARNCTTINAKAGSNILVRMNGNNPIDATTVNIDGGRVDWRARTPTTINAYSGTLDLRYAPIDFSTTINVWPTMGEILTKSLTGATVTATINRMALGGVPIV